MQLNRKQAHPDDKERMVRAIQWSQKWGMTFNGYPFDPSLAGPDGAHITLIVPPETSSEDCEQALRTAYEINDVVSHEVIECPAEWFESSKPESTIMPDSDGQHLQNDSDRMKP